ncbi:MAG: GNAT family N-acetyltransferase [Planctomycetes bacterium]|nr:GNAT family N-acetyltransferase [Planctomycetota bacterium]
MRSDSKAVLGEGSTDGIGPWLDGPGGRVVLVSHDLADAEIYCRWFNDPELHHYNCDRRFTAFSLDETVDLLRRSWIETGPDCRRFAVRLLGTGRLVGQADIYQIHADSRRARVGLEIGEKDLWGRGLGREVLGMLLEEAFGSLDLHRVEALIYSFNLRSVRLFERAGFRREGVLRERLARDGGFHDEYIYGLLAREWRERRFP